MRLDGEGALSFTGSHLRCGRCCSELEEKKVRVQLGSSVRGQICIAVFSF